MAGGGIGLYDCSKLITAAIVVVPCWIVQTMFSFR